jgi:hypothetical protein
MSIKTTTLEQAAKETEGLRSARMFDPCEAEEWLAYVRHGRKIGYEDTDTLNRMELFANHIAANTSDVFLSPETEAKIAAFMQVANRF